VAANGSPDLRATDRRGSGALLKDYRRALDGDELVLHYQPIMTLATGHVRGVEALLRWQHPDLGLLPPDSFLPAVRKDPAMRATTRWVLRHACQAAREWPGWSVSVNVTASDVTSSDFAQEVEDALSSSGLPAVQLTVELTEQALVSDIPAATRSLRQVRALGVGASLDDFGTGYSSLFYLRELPLTEVKIDRSFVEHSPGSRQDAAIVDSVVRLAHTIGLDTIAEGVEHRRQARFLQEIDCTAAQGYLWGRPVAPEHLTVGGEHPTGARPAKVPMPLHFGPRRRRARPPSTEVTFRIRGLVQEGASLHTIAAALNQAGETTDAGTRWTAATVAGVVTHLPDD
jgi:EAL domain-containing protein (putative c-di-GMP-specific phosphodiesterase class I)